jgi:hypothetical protein
MLILSPLILLLVATLALLILQWLRPGFGLSWLVSTGVTFATWLLMMFLRTRLPATLTLVRWLPVTIFNSSPALLLDRVSWPYAFCLTTLALAVLYTATARSQYQSNPFAWAGSLAMTALGLLAVLAGNPMTLMFAWAAIDLTELIILLSSLNENQLSRRAILAFSARLGGIMILAWAVVIGQEGTLAPGQVFDLNHIPAQAGIFVLLAAGLRLGIFPLHLPFSQEPRLRRGLGSVLRLVPVASSLALIARLPADIVPPLWLPYLLGFSVLAAFYCGIMWLVSSDELMGRPYWLIGWAALAVICVINGHPASSIAWGVAAILPGSLLFLFSARSRRLLFLPVLGLLGLTGLPFTPAASGWSGLVGEYFFPAGIFILLSHACLMLGYARHALRPGDQLSQVERWASVTYPTGFLALIGADIVLGIWGWPGSRTAGLWWAGLFGLAVLVLVGVTYNRQGRFVRNSPLALFFWNIPPVKAIRLVISRFMLLLRLDWLYQTAGWVYQGIGTLISGVTGILEGDGGVLWALVILSLLISLFAQGGAH